MTDTNQQTFLKNFKQGKTQLVWKWIPADLETPVTTYLKLCGHKEHGILLESIEGGANLGRYSIIGFAPDLIWTYKDGQVTLENKAKGTKEVVNEEPLYSIRKLTNANKIDDVPNGLPPMAVSGLFGYMGYDMIRLVEDIPDENPDMLNVPDSILLRPTQLAIFDNVKNMICLVTPIYDTAKTTTHSADKILAQAQERLIQTEGKLQESLDYSLVNKHSNLTNPAEEPTSSMTKKDYKNIVNKAVEYIKAGDIFQVVLGQRFNIDFDLPSFELYRSLRRLNPSPFMFHLSYEGFSIVGSSPEILVRVRDNTVTIRPIAGTRKRGATPEEDRSLMADLLADPKERSEHLMLLDLGRNDVGRIAEIGSVKVTEEFQIELYSHVMHIVSNVEGTLRSDLDCLDALFAGFPAGTVSGAPKVRAMEIIDELETTRRSYYGGCIGYISGNGDIDTCIALRTAMVKDGKLFVQAGAGIVADSNPESENQECINKAQALIKAGQAALQSSKKISN